MYEEIAGYVKEYCPNAWVISYTNPMTLCTKTLYRVFPEIKALGCCHEVFGTQGLLRAALLDIAGIETESRYEIKVNPVAVNHFTWLTEAKYKNVDLFPIYEKMKDAARGFCDEKLSFPSIDPYCKIDYVFVSKDVKVTGADIPDLVASDHRPHTADLSF
jgi:alpha-galactosidase/6-phospho-beta-glucosidase family protein